MSVWATRIKVLLLSGIFVSIANWISTVRAGGEVVLPWEAFPALITMFIAIVVGCLVQDLFQKVFHITAPSILFISLVVVLIGIPGLSPIAAFVEESFNKVGLLPLCTPILAYAGSSIGKDLDAFKKQGVAIVCTALCTFVGTYIGSAIIAEIILRVTGVI